MAFEQVVEVFGKVIFFAHLEKEAHHVADHVL